MPKMLLRRVSPENDLLMPLRDVDREAIRKMPMSPLHGDVKRRRNLKAHNLYHAVIDEACNQWPHGADPDPKGDVDVLRYWLQYKAGPEFCHRDGPFRPEQLAVIVSLLRHAQREDRAAFVEQTFDESGEPAIYVFTPDSEAFENMTEDTSAKLRRGVFELIELTLGIDSAESLVKQKLRAA